MARHFLWIFLAALLVPSAAGADAVCDQQQGQRGDAGKKPDTSQTQKAQDEGPPRWKWWLYPESRKEIRLTDQQSKKINEVWESTAPKLRDKWHELEQLEDALAKMMKEYNVDVATVAQQVEKVERLRAVNNATRTTMIYRMHLLLSAEQRVKVDEIRARLEAERKKQNEAQGRDKKY
jgi:Spy/CpxP family protein refolding chaperone